MKKIATLLLAGVLSLGILAVGASAADFSSNEVIKKGTAVVDGKLDQAYKNSANFAIGEGHNTYLDIPEDINCTWEGDCKGHVYMMYDEKNLYIFVEVSDNDILSKGEAYASNRDGNPWQNDVIELRLKFDGASRVNKFGVDAYGFGLYGNKEDYDVFDYDSVQMKTTMTGTNWTAELAIPCTKGDLDLIKSGKVGFCYNLHDLTEGGEVRCFTHSIAGEAAEEPVWFSISDEKAGTTTTTPSTTTPTTPSTPTAGGVTTAPDTFDPAIIAVALTAASGAAFVLASKKR